MPEYFKLDCSEEPHRRIERHPFVKKVSFWRGAPIETPAAEPLEFTLKPLSPQWDHGPSFSAYYPRKVPLFRDDLIKALRDIGINNFDAYDATVYDPDNGQYYQNYKAVNILGLVAAADMDKSDALVHDSIPLIDVAFDKFGD